MINLLSTCTVRIQTQFAYNEDITEVSAGTGFFWREDTKIYFVTNWHLISGRHFETKEILHSQCAIPNQINGSFHTVQSDGKVDSNVFTFTLPNIDNYTTSADIIVFNVSDHLTLKNIRCANEFDRDFRFVVSQDVYVLGFPKNISTQGFPIWKRASIASEPTINVYNGMPTFLIDTATKEGMSGAPVFAVSDSVYRKNNGEIQIVTGGTPSAFVGIYSGRLGVKEMEAQLGIVWKKEAIQNMIHIGNVIKV